MFNKVLLKLSGEALKATDGIIATQTVSKIALQIKQMHDAKIDVAIVIGAGNIWRGATAEKLGMDRTQADYMGMLATIMNSVAMQEALEKINVPTRLLTAIEVNKVAEPYLRRRALRHFEKGRVLILAGGTGSPYFSTDTCAALRAAELGIPLILMAKNGIDGVYDDDPRINKKAKLLTNITYQDIIEKHLEVIDQTAASLCADNKIKMIVFNLNDESNINKIIQGQKVGTEINY